MRARCARVHTVSPSAPAMLCSGHQRGHGGAAPAVPGRPRSRPVRLHALGGRAALPRRLQARAWPAAGNVQQSAVHGPSPSNRHIESMQMHPQRRHSTSLHLPTAPNSPPPPAASLRWATPRTSRAPWRRRTDACCLRGRPPRTSPPLVSLDCFEMRGEVLLGCPL